MRPNNRSHAIQVAAVATVIVVALYIVAVVVLNLVVVGRLTHEVDARLAAQLARVTPGDIVQPVAPGSPPPTERGSDIDDAPSFLWSVAPDRTVTALSTGAPALPRRRWDATPVTISFGATPFRFLAARIGADWVVAGQSVAEIPRVQSAFEGPEVVFGAFLLVAVFVGALLIGRRASAPVEMVRRRQSEFTADASHELRTPLSVIEAEVDLALASTREPRSDAEVFVRIGEEGRRLRKVVEDLLWLARSDGRIPDRVSGHACDLGEVVGRCAERFRAVCERQDITLEVDGPGAGPPALIGAPDEDADRLTGVLVDNACRHAGAGGRVTVRVAADGSRVRLDVEDSGSGIPTDEIPFIFDRFHRATASPGGSGLGLAIADAVVRATRGVWSVGRSRLGGAQMSVSWRRLPPRRSRPHPNGENGWVHVPSRVVEPLGDL